MRLEQAVCANQTEIACMDSVVDRCGFLRRLSAAVRCTR